MMPARTVGMYIVGPCRCEMVPDRPGQDSRYWLDSSAIKKDVGWEQEISLEEGLKEMVEWGRTYLPQLREMSTEYILRT